MTHLTSRRSAKPAECTMTTRGHSSDVTVLAGFAGFTCDCGNTCELAYGACITYSAGSCSNGVAKRAADTSSHPSFCSDGAWHTVPAASTPCKYTHSERKSEMCLTDMSYDREDSERKSEKVRGLGNSKRQYATARE